MLIHFFLLLLIAFLWLSAYFFYKKGHLFLQFLNETEESNQSKIKRMVWFQIIAGIAALLCFLIDQPTIDLIYLVVLLLVSAIMALSLVRNKN